MKLTGAFRWAALVSLVAIAIPLSASAQSSRNASRVDFDDQLIQGQVNRGAVHLIERKDSDLGSLVKVRKSYRKEILAGTAAERDPLAASASAAMMSPVPLPVVKPAEVAAAPIAAPVVKAMPAAVTAAPAVKKSEPAKKPAAKPVTRQSNTKLGGSRAVSRR